MNDELPLGRDTDYPDEYAPAVLFPIARSDARDKLGIAEPLPFVGVDIWNAWELTWLKPNGQPVAASAEIRVPADSPNIVESKSLKLYLNSFAMSRHAGADVVAGIIRGDLSAAAGSDVEIRIVEAADPAPDEIATLPGTCLDALDVDCEAFDVDPGLLAAGGDSVADQALYTHALRSLCPVTGQPDTGSLLVRYSGPAIDAASLLRYVVSYRRHQDFHEACVERIYSDIRSHCAPVDLEVYARYQRRGGIDINPFRASSERDPGNPRLWRQ